MNNEQMNTEDILNECLEALMRGESEQDCLARYPEQAEELRPLLRTMVTARQACQVTPRPEFRARARYEFRAAVADACAKQTRRGFRWNWRWSTAIPLAMALMLASGGGVLAASNSSLPGQPLYGVKLAVEQVQVTLAPTPEGKMKVYAAQADRRVNEVVALANSGDNARVGEATLRLDDTLNKVTGLMNITYPPRNFTGPTSPIAPGAYPPVAVTGAATQDNSKEASGGSQAPGSTQVPLSPALNNTSSIDPALLATLKNYAAKDEAKLNSVITSQPGNNAINLQHAITSYQTILNTVPAPEN